MRYDAGITGGRLMADWQRIRTEYIKGASYRKLEEKFGVNYKVIADRGKREGWKDLRSQTAHKILTKTIEAVSKCEADRATKLLELSDLLREKVRDRVESMDALEAGSQEFRHLSATIKDLKEIQMIRSEADIREQEARIAKLRKEAEKEDSVAVPTLVVEGLPEEFRV